MNARFSPVQQSSTAGTDMSTLLRQAWAADEARRNAAISLWVSEAGNGYPVARPLREAIQEAKQGNDAFYAERVS